MRKLVTLFAILLCCALSVIAQTKTIKGKITDQLGTPVQWAPIRIKGTKTATSADADGNFTLKAAIGQSLIITATGMSPKEIPIVDESPLNVQVTRQQSNLTEVVVTALG